MMDDRSIKPKISTDLGIGTLRFFIEAALCDTRAFLRKQTHNTQTLFHTYRIIASICTAAISLSQKSTRVYCVYTL